ncbi:MAG: hypothetical protein PHP25_04490 [Candidatus Moranbacteria bacterium]|nr:hypothetical protein [Candidatus Moranbacteria bacterium]
MEGNKNCKGTRFKNMINSMHISVIVRNIKGGKETETFIPSQEIFEKRFNCGEDGKPVNKEVLDKLGIRYVC